MHIFSSYLSIDFCCVAEKCKVVLAQICMYAGDRVFCESIIYDDCPLNDRLQCYRILW